LNLNGGYIVLGIEAPNGNPELPPLGLDISQVEKIQQKIRVDCKTKMKPEYQPFVFSETYMNESILIIWVPAGDNKPYRAPCDRKPNEFNYYVRLGSETIIAKNETYRQLMEQSASIPFDDRRNLTADMLTISPILVKRFLQEIRSELLNSSISLSDEELYKSLNIVRDIGGILVPKNYAILFFTEFPEKFFPCSKFEVVQFGDDSGGDLIEEKTFHGPLDRTIIEVLSYLDNLVNVQLTKMQYGAKVERIVSYPHSALEEAIVNATYHRSYQNTSEPNKIYLYPDRIEIISYPGPVAGISLEDLQPENHIPPVPSRNRCIGELLKELRLAEMRGTGIPKIRRTMTQNGSPNPIFDFDDARSYFRVTLPAHPKYQIVHSIRESSYLWSIGKRQDAINRLKNIFEKNPGSGALVAQYIMFLCDSNQLDEANRTFQTFHNTSNRSEVEAPYVKYFKILLNNGDNTKAAKVIENLPESEWLNDPIEIAVAFKRLRIYKRAHPIFLKFYSLIDSDPIHLHDYAQTKIEIANRMTKNKRNIDWTTITKLRNEAIELLRKCIQLLEASDSATELAWCWYDLARTMQFGRMHSGRFFPKTQVEDAYKKSIELLPNEKRFKNAHSRWLDYLANNKQI